MAQSKSHLLAIGRHSGMSHKYSKNLNKPFALFLRQTPQMIHESIANGVCYGFAISLTTMLTLRNNPERSLEKLIYIPIVASVVGVSMKYTYIGATEVLSHLQLAPLVTLCVFVSMTTSVIQSCKRLLDNFPNEEVVADETVEADETVGEEGEDAEEAEDAEDAEDEEDAEVAEEAEVAEGAEREEETEGAEEAEGAKEAEVAEVAKEGSEATDKSESMEEAHGGSEESDKGEVSDTTAKVHSELIDAITNELLAETTNRKTEDDYDIVN